MGKAPMLAVAVLAAAHSPLTGDDARRATEGHGEVARRARQELRARGPAGLQALFDAGGSGPAWEAAVDEVAGQRDASASRLYWYTDLGQALAAARGSGRPVLSLRLLGRLDEERSCANSRFFRTVLYPHAEVSRVLRERFVLHWASERPVPVVSIDMGDGRVLEGTVTGNSIHYVLDARGRVVDALPGLYGPGAFLRVLGDAERTARRSAALDGPAFATFVAQRHRRALAAVEPMEDAPLDAASVRPTAGDAAALTKSKTIVEQPVLKVLAFETKRDRPEVARRARLADALAGEARLDAHGRALLLRKHAARARAHGVAASDPDRVVALFERSLAEDTALNEHVLHRRLHGWFADARVPFTLEALNARVYAELFLTPASDPWLGLFAPETYAALEPAAR